MLIQTTLDNVIYQQQVAVFMTLYMCMLVILLWTSNTGREQQRLRRLAMESLEMLHEHKPWKPPGN